MDVPGFRIEIPGFRVEVPGPRTDTLRFIMMKNGIRTENREVKATVLTTAGRRGPGGGAYETSGKGRPRGGLGRPGGCLLRTMYSSSVSF